MVTALLDKRNGDSKLPPKGLGRRKEETLSAVPGCNYKLGALTKCPGHFLRHTVPPRRALAGNESHELNKTDLLSFRAQSRNVRRRIK
mgnify:CR=1 FL=1